MKIVSDGIISGIARWRLAGGDAADMEAPVGPRGGNVHMLERCSTP